MTREELEDQVIKLKRENIALKQTVNKTIDEMYKIREALYVLKRKYKLARRYNALANQIAGAMLVLVIVAIVWALS